jgi:hypothetical protein
LPGSLGAEVLDTARHAFAQSFDVTAVLTAAVLITASLVTLVLRGDADYSFGRPKVYLAPKELARLTILGDTRAETRC